MKKRNCRKSEAERGQHEQATRIRRMTDAQLCEYVDALAAGERPAGPDKEEIVAEFLEALAVRGDDGLRVSDATIRKIKEIAQRRGFLASTEPEGEEAHEHGA